MKGQLILQQLGYGGGIFLFGFSIVFVGLICLLTYISLQSLFFKKKKKANKTEKTVSKKPVNDFITQTNVREAEVIAAITAAVAMVMGATTGEVVIKSYRRVGSSTPAWRQAGRNDSLNNRF